jgi:hypothetical protein
LRRKYGTSMSGKGRPSPIFRKDLVEAETGLKKLWTKWKPEKV